MGKSKSDLNSVELANKIIEQYQPETIKDLQMHSKTYLVYV